MRLLTSIILILLSNHSFAQSDDNFILEFMLGHELQNENKIDAYSQYNFSGLWTSTENQYVYGIIGSEHQRLHIKLISVKKNPSNPLEYIVSGKSMVKATICDFEGVIRLSKLQEVKQLQFGVDNEFEDKGILAQGLVIAEYEFRENSSQNHSGLFKGKMYSKWYLDADKNITYDNIQSFSDGYSNNAFIGTWESYHTNQSKICNWGDYRVPQANEDFDIGVGAFNISTKYVKNGWMDIVLNHQMPNNNIVRSHSEKSTKAWWEQ